MFILDQFSRQWSTFLQIVVVVTEIDNRMVVTREYDDITMKIIDTHDVVDIHRHRCLHRDEMITMITIERVI